ncbi:MAG: type II restriction endonuclease [Fimbriimonadales bacterium]|nr:type II restriction endonuclease [Fimbriimonadales bacterium]
MSRVVLQSLQDVFEAFAWKNLAKVEADRIASNQHEFNGVGGLQRLLGSERCRLVATVVYADRYGGVVHGGNVELTWYDARERHPSRTEYRLYYPSNVAIERGREGDLFVLAKLRSGGWWLILAEQGGEVAEKLRWLLALDGSTGSEKLRVAEPRDVDPSAGSYVIRQLLASLGLSGEVADIPGLDEAIMPFVEAGRFPEAKIFSRLARDLYAGADPVQDPDSTLLGWYEVEERLFMRLERALFSGELENWCEGGTRELNVLINLVQGLLQRRKSRAGKALENHVEEILRVNNLSYSRNPLTEGRHRPDFVLPSIEAYRNPAFPIVSLTVLAVKSTVKDRWRQILNEARRVKQKHLLTLQPAISSEQLKEMAEESVVLVRPKGLRSGFSQMDGGELTVAGFIEMARHRQTGIDGSSSLPVNQGS